MARVRTLASTAPLLAVGVFLALSALELQSNDSVCIEYLVTLEPGETTEITIDKSEWLEMSTWFQHVYRLEIAGGSDDSALELWRTGSESGTTCQYPNQLLSVEGFSGGGIEIEWGARRQEAFKISPASATTESFSLTLTEIGEPPPLHMLVIPAVAHAPGDNQTFFQTDLRIFNYSDQPITTDLRFVPTQGVKQSVQISVAPQEILALDDVVLSQFGHEAATGALLIDGGTRLVAISRTYNSSETGSFGQFVAAFPRNQAAGANAYGHDPTRILLGLAKSEDFRSNVGFVEILGLDANLELEMFDGSGALVGSSELLLPANAHHQINDIFEYLAAPALDNASLTINLESPAWVFSYASVVDNLSSDPIYIPGLAPTTGNRVLVVPAAASGPGRNDTWWQTDLRVFTAGGANSLGVTFLPSDGSAYIAETLDIDQSGTLVIEDVVSSIGGSGSGALVLEALLLDSDEAFLASSRTYNVTDNGTLGQFIPAESFGMNWGTVIGVDRSADFRTNIGMVSRYEPVDVEIRLVSGTGALLGSGIWHMEADSHLQINDIFAALNAPWQTNCRVDFFADSRWTALHPYASVIDNRSGDSIYIPATWGGGGPAELELSNRENAFLIDQLPEAVGVAALPAGSLTATVTGRGDLGRADLPIQVLCLYKNALGALESAVLAIGDSLSGIAGGERFWCVLPDWISVADNAGEVTLTITGGDEEVRLVLDASANAVLFDRLEPALVAAKPDYEAYRVEVTGDLGRPELRPQVLVMYRDAESGQLRIRTAVDGQLVSGIDTDFQLLVAILDWLNRDDNSGTTTLVPACMTHSGACNTTISGAVSRASDCEDSPAVGEYNIYGEQVTFSGTTGQVVTITAVWESFGGLLYLVDPSGTVIAADDENPFQQTLELPGVILPETGTYGIWLASAFDDSYSLDISCEDP